MGTYRVITQTAELEALRSRLLAEPVLGVDTETTALDPYQGRIRLLQIATPEDVFVLDLFALGPQALEVLRPVLEGEHPVKVLHNAKFDAKMLRHHAGIELGRVFDTMLASQLVAAGDMTKRHGLADVAQRYLRERVEKAPQLSDWSGELSRGQLEYAARDVAILLPLRQALIQQLKELGLIRAAKLEFECVLPTAAMELAGMPFDVERWRVLVEMWERRRAHLEEALQSQLAPVATQMDLFGRAEIAINLNSPHQVLTGLRRLGLTVEGTSELDLLPYRDHPVVRLLLEYRSVQKLLSTFGRGFLEHRHPVTGRLHGDFHQIGTPTGRYSCSDPNIQQVPNLPEIRACFRAPAGRRLIVADYSQIELRILAEFSQDPKMLEAFLNGLDLHRMTASWMFKVPPEAVTKEQRAIAKTINFGLMYGMGAASLAARIAEVRERTDISLAEAEALIASYFEIYRRVGEWLRAAGDTAVSVRHSRSQSGRLWRFQFDPSDREQVAAIQRLGKNFPIQGTGADILKRAMRLVYDALRPYEAQIVNSIHDEIVVEVAEDHAPEVAELVRERMIAAGREFIKTVPIEVEVVISEAWTK
jgi:DNA polymerase-1